MLPLGRFSYAFFQHDSDSKPAFGIEKVQVIF